MLMIFSSNRPYKAAVIMVKPKCKRTSRPCRMTMYRRTLRYINESSSDSEDEEVIRMIAADDNPLENSSHNNNDEDMSESTDTVLNHIQLYIF